MNALNKFLRENWVSIVNYFLPSAFLLTLLRSFQKIILAYPIIIYILIFIPTLLFSVCLNKLSKFKEESTNKKQNLLQKIAELENQLPSNVKLTRTKSGDLCDEYGNHYCPSPVHPKPPIMPQTFHAIYKRWGYVCKPCNSFSKRISKGNIEIQGIIKSDSIPNFY